MLSLTSNMVINLMRGVIVARNANREDMISRSDWWIQIEHLAEGAQEAIAIVSK